MQFFEPILKMFLELIIDAGFGIATGCILYEIKQRIT